MVAVTWTAAMCAVLAIARYTRVGPVLVQIPHRHGLHLGDLATALAAGSTAALTTYVVARQR